MFSPQTPLEVILNPPVEVQEGFPGETLSLRVIIINQGERAAAIDIFLDRDSQTLSQWCLNTQAQLALAPQQSGEVTFRFQIPFEAPPETYNYTLVVNFQDYYSEETRIQYPRKLKVSIKPPKNAQFCDPTFTLTPVTNPDRALQVQPGQQSQILLTVKNRSERVDRFYLNCFDLDEDWFTVKYAPNQFQGTGLITAADGLELNPDQEGEIALELLLPEDMPAGHYSPTVQLRSVNSPDLKLLDLVYFQVPALYSLNVELKTILGKVSHQSGHYQLQMTNQGNLLRKFKISAKSQDEDEFCRYTCERSPVQLLIGSRIDVDINVQPTRWWRRPLFGSGLQIPFEVGLQDLEGFPVPERLPQGILLWKARPWWQFLLLLLGCLGLLSGIGFIIWQYLKPTPPQLADFSTDSPTYTEGGTVLLNLAINHADWLAQVVLTTTKDNVPSVPKRFDFRQGIPQELNQFCQQQNSVLNCNNINTGARLVGKYSFNLQLLSRRSDKPIEKSLNVEIKPKPLPEVVSFSSNQTTYQQGNRLLLSFNLENFSQMTQLLAIGKSDNGIAIAPTTFNFNGTIPQNLHSNCSSPRNDELSCNNVALQLPAAPGGYNIQLQPKSNNQQQPQLSETIKIQVLATAPKIVSFTLNGKTTQQSPTVFLKQGQTINLKWQVKDNGVNVTLDPFGNVPASGSSTLKATTNLSQIVLIATNSHGQSVKQAFLVQVQPAPPIPTPNPALRFTPAVPLPLPPYPDLKTPKK